jgi:hypothetical protein
MRVETGIAGRPRERFVVLEGDVSPGLGVLVALRQPEINQVEDVLVFPRADEEVVRLDVSV